MNRKKMDRRLARWKRKARRDSSHKGTKKKEETATKKERGIMKGRVYRVVDYWLGYEEESKPFNY